ncbi:AaceriAGR119Cp [[Ashbya] aceris (nom. inval.)]|nr:AaceriAGR119Cp [[Ashbya] aceris (nom. inval.)]
MRPQKTQLRAAADDCGGAIESTSKWKIPHYYKKASSVTQTVISDLNPATSSQQCATYSPTMALNGGNNRINIMNTPVAVQLEDPDQPKTRKGQKAKAKKNGEMVFVNFTVQDTAESPKKIKSSRREKMLRIFKGSEQLKLRPHDAGELAPSVSKEPRSAPASTPTSASKRNYSSFLKCGKIGSSVNNSAGSAVGKRGSVPSSLQNWKAASCEDVLIKRSSSSVATLHPLRQHTRPQLSRSMSANIMGANHSRYNSLSPVVSHNSAGSSGGGGVVGEPDSKIDLLKRRFLQTATYLHGEASDCGNTTKSPTANSHTSKMPMGMEVQGFSSTNMYDDYDDSDEIGEADFDPHYLGTSDGYKMQLSDNVQDGAATLKPNLHTSDTFSGSYYQVDENDASIAFSKMFTRKRANTGGSLSSFVSNTQTISPYNIPGNISTHSVPSQRYSPIRSHSPGRPRSNTRGSLTHRNTRDLSSAYLSANNVSGLSSQSGAAVFNQSEPVVGLDTFIDSQFKSRYGQKKKQDGTCDTRKTYQAPTGFCSTSSTSHASTPSVADAGGLGSGPLSMDLHGFWPLERDTSFINDVYDEQPLPSAKGIQSATIEEDEEVEVDLGSVPNTSNSSKCIELSLEPSTSVGSSACQYFHEAQGFTLVNTGLAATAVALPKKNRAKEEDATQHGSMLFGDALGGYAVAPTDSNLLDAYMDLDLENTLTLLSGENDVAGLDASGEGNVGYSTMYHDGLAPSAATNISPTTLTGAEAHSEDETTSSNIRHTQQAQQVFLHSRSVDADQPQSRVDFYGLNDGKT